MKFIPNIQKFRKKIIYLSKNDFKNDLASSKHATCFKTQNKKLLACNLNHTKKIVSHSFEYLLSKSSKQDATFTRSPSKHWNFEKVNNFQRPKLQIQGGIVVIVIKVQENFRIFTMQSCTYATKAMYVLRLILYLRTLVLGIHQKEPQKLHLNQRFSLIRKYLEKSLKINKF